MIAASRRWANVRPWQVCSRADSSSLVNTGTSLSRHLGGAQPCHRVGQLLFLGEPAEELLQGPELVAGVRVAVPGQQVDQPPLHVVAADLLPPGAAGTRDQVGGGEPGHGLGVGPHRLGAPCPRRPGAAGTSRSRGRTARRPAACAAGDGRCGTVIVFLSSCGSAVAHASARERFRRSENLTMSAESAMGIPLLLLLSQVRGLIFPLGDGEVFTFNPDLRKRGDGGGGRPHVKRALPTYLEASVPVCGRRRAWRSQRGSASRAAVPRASRRASSSCSRRSLSIQACSRGAGRR